MSTPRRTPPAPSFPAGWTTPTTQAAARHGFAFADVRSRFPAGHEICDGSASWLHSVDWGDMVQSYHPTATGRSNGYLPTFSNAAG